MATRRSPHAVTAFPNTATHGPEPVYFWGSNQPIVRFDGARYFTAAACT